MTTVPDQVKLRQQVFEAIYDNNFLNVAILLTKVKRINARRPNDQATFLCEAVRLERYEIVKLLLEKGAWTNVFMRAGYSPLRFAVNKPELFELLLDNGADPTIQSESEGQYSYSYIEKSVLDFIVTYNPNKQIFRLMVDRNIDLTKATICPIYSAIYLEDTDLIVACINRYGDFYKKDDIIKRAIQSNKDHIIELVKQLCA